MEVHDIVQETGIKTIPKKQKCKKAKWLSEEASQIAVKRREGKSNPRVPLRGEGSCGGGGAPRDSAGSGAMEEGLTSRGGRNLRLPLPLQYSCLENPWMEEPGRLQSMGSLRVGHD